MHANYFLSSVRLRDCTLLLTNLSQKSVTQKKMSLKLLRCKYRMLQGQLFALKQVSLQFPKQKAVEIYTLAFSRNFCPFKKYILITLTDRSRSKIFALFFSLHKNSENKFFESRETIQFPLYQLATKVTSLTGAQSPFKTPDRKQTNGESPMWKRRRRREKTSTKSFLT